MSASKLVNGVMSAGVSTLLREHGFARKGLIFRRSAAEKSAIHVVEVEVSRGSHAGEASIVLNVGTYLPKVQTVLHGAKAKEPREYDCTVRTRIGPKSKKSDPWWMVMPGEEAGIGALVAGAIEDRVLPWLDRTTDLAKLSAVLDKGPSRGLWTPDMLTPAAVALVLGKKPLAKKRIREAETSIHDTLAKRAAQFGKKDPFGSDVLKLAARLRKEHAL